MWALLCCLPMGGPWECGSSVTGRLWHVPLCIYVCYVVTGSGEKLIMCGVGWDGRSCDLYRILPPSPYRGAVVSEEDSPDGGGAGEESREVADDQAAKLEKWRKGEQDLMERNRQRREQEKAEKGMYDCSVEHSTPVM